MKMYFLILQLLMLLIRKHINRYVPCSPGAYHFRLTTWLTQHRRTWATYPRSWQPWRDEDMGFGPGGRGKGTVWTAKAARYRSTRWISIPYIHFGQFYMEKMTKSVFFTLLITRWVYLAGLANKDINHEGDWTQNDMTFIVERLWGRRQLWGSHPLCVGGGWCIEGDILGVWSTMRERAQLLWPYPGEASGV